MDIYYRKIPRLNMTNHITPRHVFTLPNHLGVDLAKIDAKSWAISKKDDRFLLKLLSSMQVRFFFAKFHKIRVAQA